MALNKETKAILYDYYNEKGKYFNTTGEEPFDRFEMFLEAIRYDEHKKAMDQIWGGTK